MTDVSTPEGAKEYAQKAKKLKYDRLDSLRQILDHGTSRKYLWTIIQDGDPFGPIREGGQTEAQLAARIAERDQAVKVLRDVMEVNPDHFLTYVREVATMHGRTETDE